MVKFFKAGRVVIVTKGKYAGKKGIIVKSSYEATKDRKYPHVLVVGIARNTRRVTKASLKRLEERTQKIEELLKKNSTSKVQERLNRLRRLGVFVKTYNMTHVLATRYKVDEDFGIEEGVNKLEAIEARIRDKQSSINKLEGERKEENKAQLEDLQKTLGTEKDTLRDSLRTVKSNVGTKLYQRYVQGFGANSKNDAANEKQQHTAFLFKKLNF